MASVEKTRQGGESGLRLASWSNFSGLCGTGANPSSLVLGPQMIRDGGPECESPVRRMSSVLFTVPLTTHSQFTSLCMTDSRSAHISRNDPIPFLFLWLSNIPLYICTTASLSIPLLIGI